MYIAERTDTKLVLKLEGNQLLGLSLQIGGVLIFTSMLMFGADFRTNPEYTAISAQSLNFAIKILGGLLAAIALGLIFSVLKKQDQAYIFDKSTSTMTVVGKSLSGSFHKQYPLSSIKEVVLGKTSDSPESIPMGYSAIPTPDHYFIILTLENTSTGLVLQHRSVDRQFIQDIVDTIQKFLVIAPE